MRHGSSRTGAASSARLTTRLRPLTTVQKESRPYKKTDIQTTECTIIAEDDTRDHTRKFPKRSDRVTDRRRTSRRRTSKRSRHQHTTKHNLQYEYRTVPYETLWTRFKFRIAESIGIRRKPYTSTYWYKGSSPSRFKWLIFGYVYPLLYGYWMIRYRTLVGIFHFSYLFVHFRFALGGDGPAQASACRRRSTPQRTQEAVQSPETRVQCVPHQGLLKDTHPADSRTFAVQQLR